MTKLRDLDFCLSRSHLLYWRILLIISSSIHPNSSTHISRLKRIGSPKPMQLKRTEAWPSEPLLLGGGGTKSLKVWCFFNKTTISLLCHHYGISQTYAKMQLIYDCQGDNEIFLPKLSVSVLKCPNRFNLSEVVHFKEIRVFVDYLKTSKNDFMPKC